MCTDCDLNEETHHIADQQNFLTNHGSYLMVSSFVVNRLIRSAVKSAAAEEIDKDFVFCYGWTFWERPLFRAISLWPAKENTEWMDMDADSAAISISQNGLTLWIMTHTNE